MESASIVDDSFIREEVDVAQRKAAKILWKALRRGDG